MAGADTGRKWGKVKEADCLAMESQLKLCIEIGVVDEEARGGVTGALFEMEDGLEE